MTLESIVSGVTSLENLQEDIIALAEGFAELGIPFAGNCD
jgi:hypothetical protein